MPQCDLAVGQVTLRSLAHGGSDGGLASAFPSRRQSTQQADEVRASDRRASTSTGDAGGGERADLAHDGSDTKALRAVTEFEAAMSRRGSQPRVSGPLGNLEVRLLTTGVVCTTANDGTRLLDSACMLISALSMFSSSLRLTCTPHHSEVSRWSALQIASSQRLVRCRGRRFTTAVNRCPTLSRRCEEPAARFVEVRYPNTRPCGPYFP
jgi:hypothetical protein